jgi:hypothetical protein
MEDRPSGEVSVSKKRGPKAKICEECRLNNAKRICTHRALPEDVDKENLALAPALRTRRRSGGMLLPRDSSTITSSSPSTTPLAVLSNTSGGNILRRQQDEGTLREDNGTVAPRATSSVVGEQMITRQRQKVFRVKLRHRSAINRLNVAKRWQRKSCEDAGKDIWQNVDSVLAAAKEGHVVDLASAKKEYATELRGIQGDHEAALDEKDKTIRRLEADIRRLKADLNNIQRGCLVDEKKVEQLEKKLVETEREHTLDVRDYRRQISDMQKSHDLEKEAICAEKDKEIKKLNAKINNITRGAIIDQKVETLEKQLAVQSTNHMKEARGFRSQISELQSKHNEEIGRMLALREERTKILNQACDKLRKSLEISRIEVGRLRVLEKEHNWQNRLLALNLGKRSSECLPEYDASAMKWTSDEGEKACQTPKSTTKFKARKIVAALYKEAQGNREYAIELLRAMTRNVVADELFSALGWKAQGRDPAQAEKQVLTIYT